jgi:hypothetical protein
LSRRISTARASSRSFSNSQNVADAVAARAHALPRIGCQLAASVGVHREEVAVAGEPALALPVDDDGALGADVGLDDLRCRAFPERALRRASHAQRVAGHRGGAARGVDLHADGILRVRLERPRSAALRARGRLEGDVCLPALEVVGLGGARDFELHVAGRVEGRVRRADREPLDARLLEPRVRRPGATRVARRLRGDVLRRRDARELEVVPAARDDALGGAFPL